MKPGKLIILIALAGLFTGCKKESSFTQSSSLLKVSFRVFANGRPVNQIDNFLNGSGESYSISVFKFYTGNYSMSNTQTQGRATSTGYFLSSMDDPASLSLEVPLQGGSYNRMSFNIGIDSVSNVSGAQTGALDPINGMFWTWNTGYIFAKLEGKSPSSSALNQSVVYHIGGFRQGENAIRQVILDFPGDQILAFGNGKKTEIVIDVNLDQWFDGVNRISIASSPVWMTPGGESLRIADNYATMFSIHELIYQ